MKRNRFTTTRFVLIVILIGGLYKVGTLVNPPPPGPPELPKAADAAAQKAAPAAKPGPQMSQADMAKQMAERMKSQQKQMEVFREKQALEKKLNRGQLLSKDDGITPVYFQETPMGKAGLAAVEKAAANTKRVNDEVNKQMASKMAALKASTPQSGGMGMPPPSATRPGAPGAPPPGD